MRALMLSRRHAWMIRSTRVRSLVDKVVVTPVDGKLTIDLHGQIAAILKLSLGRKIDADVGPLAEQLVVVAGACNRHYLLFSASGLSLGGQSNQPRV